MYVEVYVELYSSSTRDDCNMICRLQFDLHIKKPDTYSPKSLYRHHGVSIYDNSEQEECRHLIRDRGAGGGAGGQPPQ